MYQSKPDKLLGVNYNQQSGFGNSSKEYRRLTSKDPEVIQAIIRGNLSADEAALMGIIMDIAPQDEGTCRCILNNVALTRGINGAANRQAIMVDTGAVVPTWEEISQMGKQQGKEKDNRRNGAGQNPQNAQVIDDREYQ